MLSEGQWCHQAVYETTGIHGYNKIPDTRHKLLKVIVILFVSQLENALIPLCKNLHIW